MPVSQIIDALVQRGPGAAEVRAAAPAIFDAIIAAHGDLGLADSHLAGIVASPAEPAVRRAARRLGGLLAWRFGDLSAAADAFAELAKDSGDLDARRPRCVQTVGLVGDQVVVPNSECIGEHQPRVDRGAGVPAAERDREHLTLVGKALGCRR